jgi:hypothetical protein
MLSPSHNRSSSAASLPDHLRWGTHKFGSQLFCLELIQFSSSVEDVELTGIGGQYVLRYMCRVYLVQLLIGTSINLFRVVFWIIRLSMECVLGESWPRSLLDLILSLPNFVWFSSYWSLMFFAITALATSPVPAARSSSRFLPTVSGPHTPQWTVERSAAARCSLHVLFFPHLWSSDALYLFWKAENSVQQIMAIFPYLKRCLWEICLKNTT